MKYRLLTDDDIIKIGDEVLNDDTESWDAEHYASKQSNGRWFIGVKFNSSFFMPHRRKLSEITGEIQC